MSPYGGLVMAGLLCMQLIDKTPSIQQGRIHLGGSTCCVDAMEAIVKAPSCPQYKCMGACKHYMHEHAWQRVPYQSVKCMQTVQGELPRIISASWQPVKPWLMWHTMMPLSWWARSARGCSCWRAHGWF